MYGAFKRSNLAKALSLVKRQCTFAASHTALIRTITIAIVLFRAATIYQAIKYILNSYGLKDIGKLRIEVFRFQDDTFTLLQREKSELFYNFSRKSEYRRDACELLRCSFLMIHCYTAAVIQRFM